MREPRPTWDIPSSWKPALDAARAGGALLLLGESDSGKSTLAAVLASEALAAGRAAAVVDADIGQSSIGPPACVGMARAAAGMTSLDELALETMDFVGACSPAGHLLQCATSAASMAAAARRAGAETLIVDTTGLVSGAYGRGLKGAKVRLLAPDVLIALQAEDELEHLLAAYRTRACPAVVRLARSRAVRPRSRDDRAARRQQRFGAYFAGAKGISLGWDQVSIENSPWMSGEPAPGHVRAYAEEILGCEVLHAERRADGIFVIVDGQADASGLRSLAEGFGGSAHAVEAAALDRLLVGVLGGRGETLALGLLEAVNFRRRQLSILTPLSDTGKVRGLRLGAIRLGRDGTQLGANAPGALG